MLSAKPKTVILKNIPDAIYDKDFDFITAEFPIINIARQKHAKCKNIKSVGKLNDCGRYSNNASVIQEDYYNKNFRYNAVRPEGSDYVLGEGPTKETTLDTYSSFVLASTLNEKYPIEIIVAVGNHSNGTKYFTYFNSTQKITAEDFFSKTAKQNFISTLNTSIEFYENNVLIDGWFNPKTKKRYVMYLPSWPDHGIIQFSAGDIEVIAFLAKHISKYFAHCSAGLGRGPTFIAICESIRQNIFQNANPETIVEKYFEIMKKMIEVKPNIASDSGASLPQWLMGLDTAERALQYLQLNEKKEIKIAEESTNEDANSKEEKSLPQLQRSGGSTDIQNQQSSPSLMSASFFNESESKESPSSATRNNSDKKDETKPLLPKENKCFSCTLI